MIETIQPTKTIFTISQFLDWQRQGTLDLSPIFQRRPVWKPSAKSLLVDSIIRGYSLPIILLRQVQDLDTLSMKMEVVDGQQRLRTLLGFIEPACLADYDDAADAFSVSRVHNRDIARKSFSALLDEQKQRILGYEISTHIFPATTSDALVFRMFARLNSTGLTLNKQEIRNSEFHGAFKSLVYELSFSCFDQWRRWGLFSNAAISRMQEAEAVSEYLIAMLDGIGGKSQPGISKIYKKYEDDFAHSGIVRKRFETTIDTIDVHFGDKLAKTAFKGPALFYSLFTAVYDHMYGLGSPIRKAKAKPLPSNCLDLLLSVSRRIQDKALPEEVQTAVDKSTTDKVRRLERHKYFMRAMHLVSAV